VAGRISAEILQKIKASVNLADVVGEHVSLRKTGANYSGLCPFHSERTPSFSVSESKQLYHCYGCKKSGDLFTFIVDLFGVSFMEAVAEVADRGKVALPKELSGFDTDALAGETPEQQARRLAARAKLQTAYKLNRFAAAFYHQCLAKSPQTTEYFRKRGVAGDLARQFYVGFAPAGWDALSTHMVEKQAPLPLASELGLIKTSKKDAPGPGYFDLFRNRAMFPILDMRGKVVGFGGRTLPQEKPAPEKAPGDPEAPKYMNSPESFIFHKSKLVFGLFQAQKHIREMDEIILVEGYFDVLALHAAGFQNAVATCGTALSNDHLTLFKKFASKVTVLFDGDSAGISATERAMVQGLEQGAVLNGAFLPDGLDPDELVFDPATGALNAEGCARLKEILADSRPLIDASIDSEALEAKKGPEAQTQALKKVGKWLSVFKDPIGREIRVQSASQKLGVSNELLLKAMGGPSSSPPSLVVHRGGGDPRPNPPFQGQGQGSRPGKVITRSTKAQGLKVAALNRHEILLIGAIARGGPFLAIVTKASDKLPPEMTLADIFEYPAARGWIAELASQPDVLRQAAGAPERLLDLTEDTQVRSVITEALLPELPPFEESEIQGALGYRVVRLWARFSQHIKAAISDAEAKKDAGLQSKLMKEYLDVQRKMKELSKLYDEV
jgi:DNA primase